MQPSPAGTKIRVISNTSEHNYRIGQVYTVVKVDPNDGTFRGKDAEGAVGGWIHWNDCTRADSVGWGFVKSVLPGEVSEFLSAFTMIESIELKIEIKDAILRKLPNLHELIMQAQAEATAQAAQQPLPTNEDNDDPFC